MSNATITKHDMVLEGKRTRRAPKGYVFVGELYGPDYAGPFRKPSGENAGYIGNVYRLPCKSGQSKTYKVLEMNDGWTGRSLPNTFKPLDFSPAGSFTGCGGVIARQYTLK